MVDVAHDLVGSLERDQCPATDRAVPELAAAAVEEVPRGACASWSLQRSSLRAGGRGTDRALGDLSRILDVVTRG